MGVPLKLLPRVVLAVGMEIPDELAGAIGGGDMHLQITEQIRLEPGLHVRIHIVHLHEHLGGAPVQVRRLGETVLVLGRVSSTRNVVHAEDMRVSVLDPILGVVDDHLAGLTVILHVLDPSGLTTDAQVELHGVLATRNKLREGKIVRMRLTLNHSKRRVRVQVLDQNRERMTGIWQLITGLELREEGPHNAGAIAVTRGLDGIGLDLVPPIGPFTLRQSGGNDFGRVGTLGTVVRHVEVGIVIGAAQQSQHDRDQDDAGLHRILLCGFASVFYPAKPILY